MSNIVQCNVFKKYPICSRCFTLVFIRDVNEGKAEAEIRESVAEVEVEAEKFVEAEAEAIL